MVETAPLAQILNPGSVALIGASRDPGAWTNRMAQALVERFRGETYLVNPSGASILGRQTYSAVSTIGAAVDLAVVAVGAESVLDTLADCAKAGVKGAVVFAQRPSSANDDGQSAAEFDRQLLAVARSAGMRVIGPNCVGVDNPALGLNTWGALTPTPPGAVAFITQSGGIGDHVLRQLRLRGLGVSYYVSVGNETDIPVHEYLRFVRDDPATAVVALYMEGVKDGPLFVEEARRTACVKPVVLLKTGRTATGARAAASHTGALAGSGAVAAAILRQAGVLSVEDDAELVDVVEALAKAPTLQGDRIAILTEGGGHGSTAADLMDANSLRAPVASAATQARLRTILVRQPLASVGNPVDVPGMSIDPRVLAATVECLLDSDEYDGVVVVGEFGDYASFWGDRRPALAGDEAEAAHALGRIIERTGRPVVLHSIFAGERTPALEALGKSRAPVYGSIGRAIRCMAALRGGGRRADSREPPHQAASSRPTRTTPVLEQARREGLDRLADADALSLMADRGLSVPASSRATTPDEAASVAARLGYPLVMKIDSPDIAHKSDAGGVVVGLGGEAETREAFSRILRSVRLHEPKARISGVSLYRLAPAGVEVIVGALRDPQFGPVVMFGLGGVYVEILGDVAFRPAPVGRDDASAMVREVKGFPLLAGARGRPGFDVEAVIDVIVAVADLIASERDILEMDLNPVIVHASGATVADARIRLAR